MAGKYTSLYFLKAKVWGLWVLLLRRSIARVSTYRQILRLRDVCSVSAAHMSASSGKNPLDAMMLR